MNAPILSVCVFSHTLHGGKKVLLMPPVPKRSALASCLVGTAATRKVAAEKRTL